MRTDDPAALPIGAAYFPSGENAAQVDEPFRATLRETGSDEPPGSLNTCTRPPLTTARYFPSLENAAWPALLSIGKARDPILSWSTLRISRSIPEKAKYLPSGLNAWARTLPVTRLDCLVLASKFMLLSVAIARMFPSGDTAMSRRSLNATGVAASSAPEAVSYHLIVPCRCRVPRSWMVTSWRPPCTNTGGRVKKSVDAPLGPRY